MFARPDGLDNLDSCTYCGGTGLLCELHPTEPIGHDLCTSAGVSCPVCQPSDDGVAGLLAPRRVTCRLCESFITQAGSHWFSIGPYWRDARGRWQAGRPVKTTPDDPNGSAYCKRCAHVLARL